MSGCDCGKQESQDKWAEIQAQLSALRGALASLGLRPCVRCGRFFKSADPGALVDCGELVCYPCLPDWWTIARAELDMDRRQELESKLARWLIREHQAKIITDPSRLRLGPNEKAIIAGCGECRGSGKHGNARCRFCKEGNRWIVIRVPTQAASRMESA